MRKLALFTGLTLLLSAPLCLGAVGGSSPAAPPSPAAFLASLAGEPRQVPAPPKLPAIGTPAPSPRSCSISRDCGDGNVAACTGSYSCLYSQRGVTCDNNPEVACPNYCAIAERCEDCNRYLTCWSLAGDCQQTDDGISCNGGTPRHCTCPDSTGGGGGGGCGPDTFGSCSYQSGVCPAYCSCCY
jgi:hypothetical protein